MGRTSELKTDASDFITAVLNGKDVKEIAARRGTNIDATISEPGSAGGTDLVDGPISNSGGAVLREAQRLGAAANNRYVWGSTGPMGYDCSGLVWKAMRNTGVYTGIRFTTGTFPVLATSRGFASKVSTPGAGDIVLWSGHMGIVAGPDLMYNAASKKSGIRMSSISGHGGTPSYWRIKDSAKGSAGTYSQN